MIYFLSPYIFDDEMLSVDFEMDVGFCSRKKSYGFIILGVLHVDVIYLHKMTTALHGIVIQRDVISMTMTALSMHRGANVPETTHVPICHSLAHSLAHETIECTHEPQASI